MRCFIFYVHQFKLTVANHFSLAFVCGQLKLLRRVRVLQSTCLFMKPFENDVLSFNSLHIMCSNSDILALNFFKKNVRIRLFICAEENRKTISCWRAHSSSCHRLHSFLHSQVIAISAQIGFWHTFVKTFKTIKPCKCEFFMSRICKWLLWSWPLHALERNMSKIMKSVTKKRIERKGEPIIDRIVCLLCFNVSLTVSLSLASTTDKRNEISQTIINVEKPISFYAHRNVECEIFLCFALHSVRHNSICEQTRWRRATNAKHFIAAVISVVTFIFTFYFCGSF